MGISYSFSLVVGFEFSEKEFKECFQKKETHHEEGAFHMEDRFDPKTGAKVAPEKVWDKKPKTTSKVWYEIGGETYDQYTDSEELAGILAKQFDCYTEQYGSWPSGHLTWVFHVNKPVSWRDATDYGNVKIYNDCVSFDNLALLMPKAVELGDKLKALGLNVPEPRVFVAQRIS